MLKLIVERIPWLYACCDSDICAADVASASRFQNERRRTEHLAWRRVVRRELGRNITIDYNEVGAPIVDIANTYISIAHSTEHVAVAIADEKIGVDIEPLERDFERVASRYMSPEEQRLCDDRLWPAFAWCAKEALYKLYGKRGLELKSDIRLHSYDNSNRRIGATLCEEREAHVDISIWDEEMVVAVAQFRE